MPQISVIIPTYNRADMLDDAIQSVLGQTFRDFELIVVDDGSTDGTAVTIQSFGTNVHYIPLPRRGQPAATRNAGLKQATGEFIAFLDSDDLFLSHKLAAQQAILAQNKQIDVVYSNGYFFRKNPRQPTGHVLDGMPTPSGHVFSDLIRGNFLFPPVLLVRRKCLEKVGLFNENPAFFGVEDYELWLRLAANCSFFYLPGDVAAIRRHPGSISRDTVALRQRVLLILAQIENSQPDAARLHRQAFHEAYVRNHGAVSMAAFKRKSMATGLRHGFKAFQHSLQIPTVTLRTFKHWRQWRKQRESAQS